ncbi:MAG: DUF5687 family protein [Bacteroidota bacterium]
MKWLLIHYFLDRWRKILDSRDLAKNIFKIFLSVLFIFYVVMISLFAGYALKKIGDKGDIDPLQLFTRFTFYYFLIDVLLRLLFQSVPSFNINYYRTLPIKRKSLIHYPLIRMAFSFFNIIPIILFLSVFIQLVLPNQSVAYSFTWIIFFIGLIYSNNYLGVNIKFLFQKRSLLTLFLLVAFGVMLYLELEGFIDISLRYEQLLTQIFPYPFMVFIPILICGFFYLTALRTIDKEFYNDQIAEYKSVSFGRFTKSPVVNLLLLELLLIFRNKRSRVTFFMSIFLIIYAAFFFVRLDVSRNELILIGFSSMAMSIFALQHGQFLFAWESSFFDRLMTCNLTSSTLIQSKYLLLASFFLLGFLLILPYSFFDQRYFLFHLGCWLFHLGIITPILIFSGFFNTSRMELSKGVFMNFEGVGFNQFLLVIPMALLPVGTYYLGNLIQLGIGLMIIIGLFGMLLSPWVLKALISLFSKRKLLMTESYRE